MLNRPNILFLMCDEKFYPPHYENDDLKNWRSTYLETENLLRPTCMEYHNHYTASTACSPSRASMFTGHYPPLHGVSQTDGVAKNAFEKDIYSLGANTVPTVGEYFRLNGYKTIYKGKQHMAMLDLLKPGTNESIIPYSPTTGLVNQEYKDFYLIANQMKPLGFDEWVGPDPHGISPNNSGGLSKTQTKGRDLEFADDIIDTLDKLEHSCDPWFLVASFVNPHDIVFYGDYTQNFPGLDFTVDDTLPNIPLPPSIDEDLSTKPSAHSSYKNTYPKMFQPITNVDKYRKLYYSFMKRGDVQQARVLKHLMSKPRMYNNTIVVYTSDHGDALKNHGICQKWYNNYQESIHVPFIIHSPVLFNKYHSTNNVTSHIDLLPTLLEMANINPDRTLNILQRSHTAAFPPVGRRIFIEFDRNTIRYNHDADRITEPAYFWTKDHPSKGNYQYNGVTKQPYDPVIQPCAIESIVTYLDNGTSTHLYKYAIYFDPVNVSTPNEYEMYDLTTDPGETTNLAHPSNSTPESQSIQSQLNSLLIIQRSAKYVVSSEPINPVPIALQ